MNQTTPMAMKIVFHCVVMVSGMITFVTKLSTSSVKDMFLVNLVFNEVFVAAGSCCRLYNSYYYPRQKSGRWKKKGKVLMWCIVMLYFVEITMCLCSTIVNWSRLARLVYATLWNIALRGCLIKSNEIWILSWKTEIKCGSEINNDSVTCALQPYF